MAKNCDPNIIVMPDFGTAPNPKGVGYVYYHSMVKHRDRIAQIDGVTGTEQTFGALLKRCIQAAVAMQKKGIQPGDFISMCTFNHFDTCVPYIASLFVGAVMAAVEPTMSATEITYLLKQVLPKIIFVEKQSIALIEEVVNNLGTETLIVVFGKTNHNSFSDFLVSANKHVFSPREAYSLEETALVIFSSGTTGKPKGICHTHTSMLSNLILGQEMTNLTLSTFSSPYWSVFPLSIQISLVCGLAKLIYPCFDPSDPWKILKHKIHYLFLNTLQSMAFLKHAKPDNIDSSNIGHLAFSGTYISKENIQRVKALFPNNTVFYVYGQSEVFSNIFSFRMDPKGTALAEKYPNSVGLPIHNLAYKIVDIDTEKILGSNQEGELRIRSKSQTKGYLNHDSSEPFDSDGWLKTGDLAYYNEEKCFFITDRIKESFKYLHLHIIPNDIEDVLLKHPAVKQGAVIGFPHETDTNHPMGVVMLQDEGQNVTPQEIVTFVNERVEDKNRLRAGVKIVKRIPMTVTDKINRLKLREMIINKQI